MSISVLISTFSPFPTLALSVPSETSFSELYQVLASRYPALPLHSADADLILSPNSGPIPEAQASLSSLVDSDADAHSLISLRLVPRLRGGKGGFGSQLRAAGGRMSSQKTSNNDSCRDLSGRRLSTIKEAKKLAEYIESEPLRKKAQQEAQRAKLEALEKKLGITPGSSSSADPLAGKKHRLEDSDYIEQSRDLVENVKSAVSVAMLKKKKKAKTAHSSPPEASSSKATSAIAAAAEKVLESASAVTDKVLESSSVAAATAAAVGVASA
ncbi:telomere stability and silencing-domain-containing protein [Trametes gibbosa]|nr:telomere stability and silencing-domain-containing protein [Trametes gibbosa]